MPDIQCFLIEPTDRVRQKLRRYASNSDPERRACSLMSGAYSYHNAEVAIEDALARYDERGYIINGLDTSAYAQDQRWPVTCPCGYQFTDDDTRQLFVELIYRHVDTREEMTLRNAPAGAMWYAPWVARFYKPQLPGGPIIVKLPDGTDWQIDSQATNCTLKDDFKQELHHCWVIEGGPPRISVTKNGPTCGAGAGSIQTSNYHGFLRNGVLSSC